VNCEDIECAKAQDVVELTSQSSAVLANISNTLLDNDFLWSLQQHVNVSATRTKTMKKKMISPKTLAKNWSIGI
jgi:hypothetical protein